MTKLFPTRRKSIDREAALDLASSRIDVFVDRFEAGWDDPVFDLACHAAFPLTLTSDLLYCLRKKFIPDCPWYDVADVLLSGLCQSIGDDLYEMQVFTRHCLLRELRDRFGDGRVEALAAFMTQCIEYRVNLEGNDRPRLLAGEPQWAALACLPASESKVAIQQKLQALITAATTRDRLRLAALTEYYEDLIDPLGDLKIEPILLAIDPITNAAIAAQAAGFTLKTQEVEVATIQFVEEDEDLPIEELRLFEFETVIVSDRGRMTQWQTKQAFYYVEPLVAGQLYLELVAIPGGGF